MPEVVWKLIYTSNSVSAGELMFSEIVRQIRDSGEVTTFGEPTKARTAKLQMGKAGDRVVYRVYVSEEEVV
jgi:hypothetical protein